MTKSPALSLPLHGRHWIEASAGTGKTFTLSLLVLRLLLEREIALPNILAVTFTNAATEELKIKIRAQIKLAKDLLQPGLPDNLVGLDAGKRVTAELLQSVLLKKSDRQLLHLLDVALQDCDRASIFTIHSFCSRVLANHALNAGQVLQAPSLLANTAALNTKIALDIWREFSADRESMRSLVKLWPSPDLLAKQCDSLLQAEHLMPALPEAMPDEFDMSAQDNLLHDAIEQHMQNAKDLLEEAGKSGIINRVSFKPEALATAFDKLSQWHVENDGFLLADPGFSKLRSQLVKTKKNFQDREPRSPLFDAVENWYQAYEKLQGYEHARDIHCLHSVRNRLRARRETLLQTRQQYTYDDLISQVLRGLESESGTGLCEDLRKDYPVALVDEFQDTDSQQWKIFSILYPESLPKAALYLIGDPKQAIYGFRGGDVHAYLAAKRETNSHWNLPENFRSRPSLLGAVESLFDQGGENAFREPDIRFFPVHGGGTVQESDFVCRDKPVHAMEIAVLPEHADSKKPLPVPKARELATRACVEKIHDFLVAGQQKTALVKDRKTGGFKSLRPGDIAVLVNKNSEAVQLQAALSVCGIASVISSRENLFETVEAREVFIILDALVNHQDQSRWRGALSTVLLGYHADQIRQLACDDAAAARSADLAVHYRELWLKQGVLSLLSQLCADAAPEILPLADGERRLSNYLQLAETLQQAATLTLGPEQCLRWLGQAMQEVGTDEENMLRLDSDQKRVKILTLHKSKGLEFPLVFMPFANFGKKPQTGSGLGLLNYHEQHRRITHAMLPGKNNETLEESIKVAASEEQLAEQIRLLYVGLTRAQYYCWICCGSVNQGNTSGLTSLLFRNGENEIVKPLHADFLQRLIAIGERNRAILIEGVSVDAKSLARFRDEQDFAPIAIANPSSHLQLDWRVLSFSQLAHAGQHQGPVVSAAVDEIEPASHLPAIAEDNFDRRFSGIAFGNALHQVLENASSQAWREHADASGVPESETAILEQALLRQGYAQDELAAGVSQLAPLIANTLRVRLPEGVRLCDLPEHERLNEMEFHFSLRECDSRQLLALLKNHGVLQAREEFPSLRKLNGLMTGKIDLIYRHEGRFYISDYKSNRLPGYDVEQCRQAMRASEYDFQALIYTLALHRWCRFRLQAGYDYEKHIGGIRYLFCRGLDAAANNGEGIVALRFERALIERLEDLLHPAREVIA